MLGQRGENGEDSDSDSEDLLIYNRLPDGSHGNTLRSCPPVPNPAALCEGCALSGGSQPFPRGWHQHLPYGGTPISPTCLGGTPSWGGLLQAAYHDGSQGNTNSAADLLPVADDSCVTQSLGGPSEQGEVAGQAASGGTGQGRIEQAPEPSPADWLHLKVGLRAAALAGNSDMVRVMLRYLGEGVAFTLQDMVVSQIASVVASITNSTALIKPPERVQGEWDGWMEDTREGALLVQWDHQIAWSLLSDANEGAAWDPPLREPPSQICGGALAKEGARDKKAAKDKKGAKDKEGAPPWDTPLTAPPPHSSSPTHTLGPPISPSATASHPHLPSAASRLHPPAAASHPHPPIPPPCTSAVQPTPPPCISAVQPIPSPCTCDAQQERVEGTAKPLHGPVPDQCTSGLPNGPMGTPVGSGGNTYGLADMPNGPCGMPTTSGGIPNGPGGMPDGLGGMPTSLGGPPNGVGGMPNGPSGTPKDLGGMPNGPSGMPNGPGGMPNGLGGMPNGPGGMPNGQGGMPNGQSGMPNGSGGLPNGPRGMYNGPGGMLDHEGMDWTGPWDQKRKRDLSGGSSASGQDPLVSGSGELWRTQR
eukprot:gene31968-33895_t